MLMLNQLLITLSSTVALVFIAQSGCYADQAVHPALLLSQQSNLPSYNVPQQVYHGPSLYNRSQTGALQSNNWDHHAQHEHDEHDEHHEYWEHHEHEEHREQQGFINFIVTPSYFPDETIYPYQPVSDDNSYVYTTPDNSAENVNQTEQNNSGTWAAANNGNVPDNAILYQNDANGNPTYFCRANYRDQLYYGVLVPNEGCYAQDQGTSIRFDQYEVRIAP